MKIGMKLLTDPFFIVSSGRSGTTLLGSMLNTCAEIMILPESDFIARAFPFYFSKNEFSNKDYTELIKIFRKTSLMNGWNLQEKLLLERLQGIRPHTFAQINSLICGTYLIENNRRNAQWGIKMPNLIVSLDRIFSVFPDAKIVHLVRDGRDVALSYRKVHEIGKNFGPKNIIACALYWIDGLRRVVKNLNHQILEIRYEDLVLDTYGTLESICSFLNVPYNQENFEQYHLSSNNFTFIPDEHKNSIHSKVHQAVDKKNIHKFRKKMKKKQIFIFELLTAPFLLKYDYSLVFRFLKNPLLGAIRLPAYLFAQMFNDVRYSIREMKIYKSVQNSIT